MRNRSNRPKSQAAMLFLFLSFGSQFLASSYGVGAPVDSTFRLVTLEWIPLHAHREIVDVVKTELQEASAETRYSLESIDVFGDIKELDRHLERIRSDPPQVMICFGAYLTGRVLNEGPKVPLIAALIRNAQGFVESATVNREYLTVIDSDPDPETIWKLARELKPGMDTLCVLHTAGFEPNQALVDHLREAGQAYGLQVVSATVGAGFCRTESDFQKALDLVLDSNEVDVLFVPDDPNCSRFGTAVYRFSEAKGWPAIGSDATIGKGCVAAVKAPLKAIGFEISEAILSGGLSEPRHMKIREVPTTVQIDSALAEKWGFNLSWR